MNKHNVDASEFIRNNYQGIRSACETLNKRRVYYKQIQPSLDLITASISERQKYIKYIFGGVSKRLRDNITNEVIHIQENIKPLIPDSIPGKSTINNKYILFNTEELKGLSNLTKYISENLQQVYKLNDMFKNLYLDNINMFKDQCEILYQSIQDIDFQDVKVNTDGTLNYLNEDINLSEEIKNIDDCFDESSSGESNNKLLDCLKCINPIMSLILCIFFILPISAHYIKSKTYQDNKILVKDNLAENKLYINEVQVKILNRIGEMVLGTCSIYKSSNNFCKNNPMIFNLLWLIIEGLFKNIYGKYKIEKNNIPNVILKDKKRVIKLLEKSYTKLLKDNIDSTILEKIVSNNVRIVNKNNSIVRTNNNMEASVLYRLPLGEVVVVLAKDKNWIKIEFVGEDNEIYVGWINTIYTSRVD